MGVFNKEERWLFKNLNVKMRAFKRKGDLTELLRYVRVGFNCHRVWKGERNQVYPKGSQLARLLSERVSSPCCQAIALTKKRKLRAPAISRAEMQVVP